MALICALAVVVYSTFKKLKGADKETVNPDDEIVFEVFEEEEGNHSEYVPEVQDLISKKKEKKKEKGGPVIGEEPIIAYAVPLPEEAVAPGAISQVEAPKAKPEKGRKKKKKKEKEPEIIATPMDTPIEEETVIAEAVPEVEETQPEENENR